MAAKLQCEICGGKLVGKPGGVFECEYCGMEYSTAWAKEKIQQITGTVKVEGTVEVQGKVQVEGPVKVEGAVNKESLLKRGEMALEDGNWDQAKEFFDQALNADASCAEAYLGLALADKGLNNSDAIASMDMHSKFERLDLNTRIQKLEDDRNFKNFYRFASDEQKTRITNLLNQAKVKGEELRRIEAQKEQAQLDLQQRLPELRKKQKFLQGLIAVGQGFVVGVKSDGTVIAEGQFVRGTRSDGTVVTEGDKDYINRIVGEWTDIIAVAAGDFHVVGLKSNGTVVAAGKNTCGQCNVGEWRSIVAISAGAGHTVGLRRDGSVVATRFVTSYYDSNGKYQSNKYHGQCEVFSWRDITSIAAGDRHTVGLKSDGTVIATKYSDSFTYSGQCEVSGWKDVVSIASDDYETVGVKADGTVVSAGYCGSHRSWKNILFAAGGNFRAFGLAADGTVDLAFNKIRDYEINQLKESKLKDWINIVAISANGSYLAGLQSDGSVLFLTMVFRFSSIIAKEAKKLPWKLFDDANTAEQQMARDMKEAEIRRKIAAAEQKKQEISDDIGKIEEKLLAGNEDLSNLKGIFSGVRRSKVEKEIDDLQRSLSRRRRELTDIQSQLAQLRKELEEK